jgi:hypothetical protein
MAATAQDFQVRTIDFDLAENPEGGATEFPFPQGVMFRVRVLNVVPALIYRFIAPSESFDKRRVTLLEAESQSGACGAVLGDIQRQLSSATSEVAVRDIVQGGRGRAEAVCDEDQMAEMDSWTTVTFKVGVLSRGERFTFEARRSITWSLTVFIESETTARVQLYDESFAVVVGIDLYPSPEWPQLSYAVKDAKAMAQYLTRNGFEVITLYDQDATKSAIVGAMQNNLARRVGARDRVLVFFAGHGYTETLGGQEWGYIVPYDGGDSSAGFISMEELQGQSAKMGAATHQLFIMDSCYGGTLGTRGVSPLNPGIPGYLEEVTRRPARQIITAGGKNQQVADGGPRGHSVFTGYLLEALEDSLGDLNGDGYITFSELNAYLVPRATSTLQTPAVGYLPAHGLGEFTFRSPRGEPVEGPPAPPPEPRAPVAAADGYGGFTGRQAAERIVSEYLGAHLSKDVEALMSLVDLPFYLDSEILVRRADLAEKFRALFTEITSVPVDFRIESVRAKTIGELKAEGYDPSRDRVLKSLYLEDTDYAITVVLGTLELGSEAGLLFARRTPSGLRIVGTWD